MNTLLFALFFFVNAFPNADSLITTSQIDQVTVHRQQAQIQRKATVNLKAGKNIVVFERLSPSLNQNSIQLKADGQFTVLSITQRFDYFKSEQQNPEVSKLKQQRDSLQQEVTFLESDLNVIQREMRLLESTTSVVENHELTAAELTQFLDLYRSRASKLERERISLSERINRKRTELNKVNAQIRELSGSHHKRFSEVIAEVSSEQDQTLTFSLSYLVRSAGWTPTYDLRSQSVSEPLSINYKAKVYQNTGIDWDNVSLTINSGNPSVSATLPTISPTYVDFVQAFPAAAKQRMLNELVVTGYAESDAVQRAEMPMEAQLPSVDFAQNQTSFSYKINIPYTIPSDGKAHNVEIKRAKVVTDYTYSTIPKYAQNAYLIGKISDWDELNLIAGETNVYFDNSFIGTTRLNPNSFDDTLSVSLGRDEGITVDRTKLRDFEERNFFGNRVREKHAWEINIRNTKSEPITITVKDQLPISKNEDIKVNANRLSGGNLNKETGIVTWTLTLTPNSSESLRFDYQVEYPSDQQIRY